MLLPSIRSGIVVELLNHKWDWNGWKFAAKWYFLLQGLQSEIGLNDDQANSLRCSNDRQCALGGNYHQCAQSTVNCELRWPLEYSNDHQCAFSTKAPLDITASGLKRIEDEIKNQIRKMLPVQYSCAVQLLCRVKWWPALQWQPSPSKFQDIFISVLKTTQNNEDDESVQSGLHLSQNIWKLLWYFGGSRI